MTTPDAKPKSRLTWLHVVIILAAATLISEILACPTGNFPLNDDWSFAVGVKNLVDTGRLTITSWTLAGAVFSVLSAVVVCKIAGFSFYALRAYVFVLSMVGLLACGCMGKRVGAAPPAVLFALAIVFFDPLYFNLTNSYMLDVQTAGLLFAGVSFLVRSWRHTGTKRLSSNIFGATLLALAVSNREVTVLFPVAYFLFGLFGKFRLAKITSVESDSSAPESRFSGPSVLESALPLILSGLVIGTISYWIVHVTGIPFCMTVEKVFLQQKFATNILLTALMFLLGGVRLGVYLGLVLLPMSAFAAPRLLGLLKGKAGTLLTMITVEIVLLIPLGLIFSENIMPLADNLIYNFGLGPLLFTGIPGGQAVPVAFTASKSVWLAITVFSGIGLGLLCGCVSSVVVYLKRQLDRKQWTEACSIVLLLLVFCLLYSVAICLRGFFDRYLILLLMPLTVILNFTPGSSSGEVSALSADGVEGSNQKLGRQLASGSVILAYVTFCALALYSIAGTRDYFSMQRAKWDALKTAMNVDHREPAQMNGGYEFNHWYTYEPDNKVVDVTKDDERRGNNKFVVALEPLKGYRTVKKYPFDSIFWGSDKAIFYQEKEEKEGN